MKPYRPKQTPGPYRLVTNASGIRGKTMVMAGESHEIAVVKMQATIPATEATGFLLAAAPDLLEAARLASSYLADCLAERPCKETVRRLAMLETAILKAEGKIE